MFKTCTRVQSEHKLAAEMAHLKNQTSVLTHPGQLRLQTAGIKTLKQTILLSL